MSGKNLYVAAAVAFPILVLAAWTGFCSIHCGVSRGCLLLLPGMIRAICFPAAISICSWIGTKLIAGNFLERFVRVSVFAKNMFTMFPRPKPALWNS